MGDRGWSSAFTTGSGGEYSISGFSIGRIAGTSGQVDRGLSIRRGRHLLKALARAYRWSDDLFSGRVKSVADIAKRERVDIRYVRRVMQLRFLAPKIVEAIVDGRHPEELTTIALTRRIDLPALWSAQRHVLGIG